MSHQFKIVNCDTDSISYCKEDFSNFTKEEQTTLLNEINKILPPKIQMDDDGYYHTVIVFKAKNYILYDGKTIKRKGSALKSANKEQALKDLNDEIIQAIIDDKLDTIPSIYNRYILEASDVKDITRWSSKKNISQKVLSSERTNEKRIRDAIEGSDVVEGDKIRLYRKADQTLSVAGNFDGEYDKQKLYKRIFDSTRIFENVIDISQLLNYSLVKNQEKLCALLGVEYVKPVRAKKTKVKKEEPQLQFDLDVT